MRSRPFISPVQRLVSALRAGDAAPDATRLQKVGASKGAASAAGATASAPSLPLLTVAREVLERLHEHLDPVIHLAASKQ